MNERITVEQQPGIEPDTIRMVVTWHVPQRMVMQQARQLAEAIRDGRIVIIHSVKAETDPTLRESWYDSFEG